MKKILTVCRAGLVRSVALADVLKLHYRPVDVLTCGIGEYEGGRFNQDATLEMLFNWADIIIVMEQHYRTSIPQEYLHKLMVCDVGPDTYGSSKNPRLIDLVWKWARDNKESLGTEEHNTII